MTKINLKAQIETKKEKHTYTGKAIKTNNKIIYKDRNTLTTLIIADTVTIERKSDYKIILNLKKGIKLKGEYITKYGPIKLEAIAHEIKKTKNKIKIKYDLLLNDEYVDTFTYNCEYSIDT